MVFYHTSMLEEINELPFGDIERIIQTLHSAFADNLPKIVIPLRSFRDGEELMIYSHEYSELYKSVSQ